MFSRVILIPIALCLVTASGACKDDDSCTRLSDSLAKASGASGSAVDAWMKAEMTGPDGEALSSAERDTTCAMILGEKEVLTAYQEAATASLKK